MDWADWVLWIAAGLWVIMGLNYLARLREAHRILRVAKRGIIGPGIVFCKIPGTSRQVDAWLTWRRNLIHLLAIAVIAFVCLFAPGLGLPFTLQTRAIILVIATFVAMSNANLIWFASAPAIVKHLQSSGDLPRNPAGGNDFGSDRFCDFEGAAALHGRGQFERAIAAYTALLHTASKKWPILANRALARVQMKDWDNALADANEALRLAGADPTVSPESLTALRKLPRDIAGEQQKCLASPSTIPYPIDQFESALHLVPRPSTPEGKDLLKRAEDIEAQQPQQALALLDQLIELEPTCAGAYFARGTVLAGMARYLHAQWSFLNANGLCPGNAWIEANLANCCNALGDDYAADKWWQLAQSRTSGAG